MPANRGRTITSFGQLFGTISGGVTFVPVEPPVTPVQVQQGPHLRSGQPVSPRLRRLLMRGIFPDEISELEEEELRIILLALDLFDD